MNSSPLLILGASVRAAAFSALRAGLQPWGADLFGDADLQGCGRFARIENLSHACLAVAKREPAGPWLYTGALENRPHLLEQISRARPLWGNPAEVLRRVRSPRLMQQVLSAADVPCPEIRARPANLAGRTWLLKPHAGAGGRGIGRWSGRSTDLPRTHYLQEFIDGEPCAAIYVGGEQTTILLGVTRQLVGQDWLHAEPFHYCGSIGPLLLEESVRERFQRLGDSLTTGFRLRGLYGVDCILRDGVPWPVEINPRYTASVEVLELARGISALALHRQVFDSCASEPLGPAKLFPGVLGKAVLFARAALSFPKDGPWSPLPDPQNDLWSIPAFADVPRQGQQIGERRPILTLFAKAASIEKCEKRLRDIAVDLDRRLFAR